MTGSALVTTRLSRVAMNIGRDAATIASQTGMRAGARCGGMRTCGASRLLLLDDYKSRD